LEDASDSMQSASRDAVTAELARSEVQRMCGLLLQLPVQWGALLQGVNPKTHLAEVTGISKSRIAEGALNELRPSTVARAAEYSKSIARERAIRLGWSESEFDEALSSAPRLSDGLYSQLGGMFHVGSKSDAVELEETTRLAVALEELVVQLSNAAAADAWHDARNVALAFLSTEVWQESGSVLQLTGLETAEGWDELHFLLDRLLMDAFEGLFVTLDAEWGAQYFRSLQPQPVLLWLSPEVDLDSEGKLARRNGIRRPIRKLLELTLAITERAYSGRWPDGPPGRSAVGDILEQSDANAGNYFDGTRKLSMKSFETWWLMLTAEMRRKFGKAEQLAAPFMLARVALLWQSYWVKAAAGKARSIIVLDQDEYRRRWHAMRRRLATRFPEGQGDWPDWLTAQLSSSPSTGSPLPPSSGRSS
jgi:hypothetical protein